MLSLEGDKAVREAKRARTEREVTNQETETTF